jgi:predicted metalloprotease with PDZ domain
MKSAQASRTSVLALAAAVAAVLAHPAHAATTPQPVPLAPLRPAPKDVAFPGVIQLDVDARDVAHRYFQVRERIPAPSSGPMTLLYPQWIPGEPTKGPIEQLAGLVIAADGVRLKWARDPVDMYAFHIDVPAGVKTLELQYQYLGSAGADTGRVVIKPTMLALEWHLVALYPAGFFSRDITYKPSVRLPFGWGFASALDGAVRTDDTVAFAPVDLQALVDSPVMAGRYFKRVSLVESPAPVWLDVVADTPDELEIPSEAIERHRELVIQADKLFGTHHFDHYDFLAFLSNDFGDDYIEHHRSSEQSVPANFFTNWAKNNRAHPGLTHGFVHSWNAKFRRPAGMWTADFNTPLREDLLWVLEGQTMYWQAVLAARAGLSTHEDALNALVSTAAEFQDRAGAQWRPLQDTTNDEIIQQRRPVSWDKWQRDVFDSFFQGELIWLDADTLIRERTGGRRSLDDFARDFFGGHPGEFTVDTYRFEDVVAALDKVAPYDWAGFFRARLDSYDTAHALDGITRGGYRLVFDDQPAPLQQASEAATGVANLSYSLGLIIGRTGEVQDAIWGGPGFEAGLALGDVIDAVNDQPYSSQAIKVAVQAAGSGAPLSFQVKTPAGERTVSVAWRGGLRYPHLQAIPGAPTRLDDILAPKA